MLPRPANFSSHEDPHIIIFLLRVRCSFSTFTTTTSSTSCRFSRYGTSYDTTQSRGATRSRVRAQLRSRDTALLGTGRRVYPLADRSIRDRLLFLFPSHSDRARTRPVMAPRSVIWEDDVTTTATRRGANLHRSRFSRDEPTIPRE